MKGKAALSYSRRRRSCSGRCLASPLTGLRFDVRPSAVGRNGPVAVLQLPGGPCGLCRCRPGSLEGSSAPRASADHLAVLQAFGQRGWRSMTLRPLTVEAERCRAAGELAGSRLAAVETVLCPMAEIGYLRYRNCLRKLRAAGWLPQCRAKLPPCGLISQG